MAMENGNIATDLDERSSVLSCPTASASSTNTTESGPLLISPASTRSAQMVAQNEAVAHGGHATPVEVRMLGRQLQESAFPPSLPSSSSYGGQPGRARPVSASPSAPLDFNSYSMAMLRHTQTQLEATPESPPPPSHIRVARPISYRQRRSQAHYLQQQQQQQQQQPQGQHGQQARHYHSSSPQASRSDDLATTISSDASTAASDAV